MVFSFFVLPLNKHFFSVRTVSSNSLLHMGGKFVTLFRSLTNSLKGGDGEVKMKRRPCRGLLVLFLCGFNLR